MFKIQNKGQVNPEAISILNSAIKKQEQILYMRSNNDKLTVACLSIDKIIVRECSMDATVQVSAKAVDFQKLQCEISFAFIEGGDAFVVYKSPFSIYYLTKQEQKPIKLVLDAEFSYKNTCIIDLNYPSMIIYGSKQNQARSQVIQLNLETLATKTINDGKGYTPGIRGGSMSVMMDGRIYVFGGKDQHQKPCEKMIWVYDMEKGYWFALEMNYPDEDYTNCQSVAISQSRALIFCKEIAKAWVFQIHQSRITEVQGTIDFTNKIIQLKGQLIRYNKKQWKLEKKKVTYHKK